jgi:hypothetical protein
MPYVISKQHPPLATIHQHLWQAKCRLPLCIVIRWYSAVLFCFHWLYSQLSRIFTCKNTVCQHLVRGMV